MEILKTIFLAVLQGITEFLPVSSSAHLLLFSDVVNGATMPLSFNVALHMGTMFAIIWCFKEDWLKIFGDFLKTSSQPRLYLDSQLGKLALATVPAGIIGLTFKDQIELYFHNVQSIIAPLAIVGVLLWFVDIKCESTKKAKDLGLMGCLFVGLFQALALIPGVSRSGITMLAARLLGVSRTEAARFSFWLGTPIMVAAGILEFKHLMEDPNLLSIVIGIIASFVSGVLTMKFLLRFLARFGFGFFAVYRLLLAAAIFIVFHGK